MQMLNRLKEIEGLEAMLKDIPITNSDEDVAQLEALLRKAKSKAKVTSSLIKDPEPLVYHDGTVGLRSTEDAIEDFECDFNLCCHSQDGVYIEVALGWSRPIS